MAEPTNHLDFDEVDFVSLVPAGDNPQAKAVLIYKSAPSRRNPVEEPDAISVAGMPDPTPPSAAPQEGASDSDALLKSYLDAVTEQNNLLKAQNETLVKILESDEDADEDFEDADDDDVVDKAKGKKIPSFIQDKIDAADGADDEGDDDKNKKGEKKMAKSLDEMLKGSPELASVFKGLQDQVSELSKKATDADTIAKAERDARLTVEFAKRADSLSGLGVPKDEMTATLRKAFDQLDVDTYVAIEGYLAKAATVVNVESDLFKEQGHSGDADAANDKFAQLVAKSKGSDDGKTIHQSLVDDLLADPSIYNDFIQNGARR